MRFILAENASFFCTSTALFSACKANDRLKDYTEEQIVMLIDIKIVIKKKYPVVNKEKVLVALVQ